MRTVIHVGQHKTGTTSIQHYLRDNRPALAEQGVWVPASLAGFDAPSHFALNVYALAEGRSSKKKEELSRDKNEQWFATLGSVLQRDIATTQQAAAEAGCHTVIWSNEGLYLLDSVEEYAKLRALFDPFFDQIETVCCFREVGEYRESYKRELERQGRPPNDDPTSDRYLAPNSWLFDYDRKRRLLGEVFDANRSFDYQPADNIAAFFRAAGFNSATETGYRLNASAKQDSTVHRLRSRWHRARAGGVR